MKKLCTFVLSILLFSSVSFASDIPEITQPQLLSLQSAPKVPEFIVLDVRTAQEFNEHHIKGAINVSHTDIEAKLSMLEQYKDTMVIVHCRSGKRANIAQDILVSHGFSQVKHLAGDMNAWLASDLPTINQ
ncbi:rhodanese-like domain-containing protein [Thalassotalea piscium]